LCIADCAWKQGCLCKDAGTYLLFVCGGDQLVGKRRKIEIGGEDDEVVDVSKFVVFMICLITS
jgi:hypothetical protein